MHILNQGFVILHPTGSGAEDACVIVDPESQVRMHEVVRRSNKIRRPPLKLRE